VIIFFTYLSVLPVFPAKINSPLPVSPVTGQMNIEQMNRGTRNEEVREGWEYFLHLSFCSSRFPGNNIEQMNKE